VLHTVGWGVEPVAKKKDRQEQVEIVGFLGVGLDNEDGHQRLTRSEHFFLIGGSEETHERMQDTALRFTAALEQRGKKLQETSVEEAVDLLRDALDS
jgi:hypothetical protein